MSKDKERSERTHHNTTHYTQNICENINVNTNRIQTEVIKLKNDDVNLIDNYIKMTSKEVERRKSVSNKDKDKDKEKDTTNNSNYFIKAFKNIFKSNSNK